jgi:hypothetical protein
MKNLNHITKYLLVALLLLCAYLFGQLQAISKTKVDQTSGQVEGIKNEMNPSPSPTPTPYQTPKTNTIKQITNQTTPTSIERKKVPVTLSDPYLSGTFYCYEDKANEIMTAQSNLSFLLKGLDMCASTIKSKNSLCFSDCSEKYNECSQNCKYQNDVISCLKPCEDQSDACNKNCLESAGNCDEWVRDIEKERERLRNLKQQYCP